VLAAHVGARAETERTFAARTARVQPWPAIAMLDTSEAAARDALAAARAADDDPHQGTVNSLCYVADAPARGGRSGEALAVFDAANVIERDIASDEDQLHSYRGIQWARRLIRLGQTERAQAITEANLRTCERNGWQDDVAHCDVLLGVLATLACRFPDAVKVPGPSRVRLPPSPSDKGPA
jgi:hypothetical protein